MCFHVLAFCAAHCQRHAANAARVARHLAGGEARLVRFARRVLRVIRAPAVQPISWLCSSRCSARRSPLELAAVAMAMSIIRTRTLTCGGRRVCVRMLRRAATARRTRVACGALLPPHSRTRIRSLASIRSTELLMLDVPWVCTLRLHEL